jgi:hypothetical protein
MQRARVALVWPGRTLLEWALSASEAALRDSLPASEQTESHSLGGKELHGRDWGPLFSIQFLVKI